MKKNIILISVLTLISLFVHAQDETTKGLIWSSSKGLEYSIKAGFNIGGTAPFPLPEEIRSIKSYTPSLGLNIEGSVTKWFSKKWGAETGIRLESKGMRTNARVKNYSLEMTGEGGYLKGRWTGLVKTKVYNTYITVPLLASYKLTSRWKLHGGTFFSYMTEGEFSGEAYNGYLRDENPTGSKVEIGEEGATYDFSDDLSKFQWGAEVGAEWKAFKHLSVHSKLTWGFKDIFKSNFDTITFGMYPIYLNVGFGYLF
ncbi:porin family protein [Bacteroides sp. 224]|uniref:porin family protein n=1 Tax=Bacteroides sp. 224 TaxID=2302936 RepID=UPI0013D47F41|nr:porin family protein [Bacteroides sp. 224]NDV65079.1 PorT family protein [Bacteroides sp. 224]